ncbi:MAG TPA: hypothetical protein VFE53_05550 [Mucilaginibacter sp.]|jgi:hypothetical protein|nr:hypothetical protein [Mucilaginibacter sp.]
MKKAGTLLLLFFTLIKAGAQAPDFQIKFSEPLGVFEFVDYLSANAPDNPYKTLFTNSKFNQQKYKDLVAAYDKLNIDYDYEYTAYPYGQKIGGSTHSLLKKWLIKSASIQDFKFNALGIIPNADLFSLVNILNEFEPVYQQLMYVPNKDVFEHQLQVLKNLVAAKNIQSYFMTGEKFYHSAWDNTIPFQLVFYPLPGTKHFTATAFYDNAVSALPVGFTNYNKLLSVMLHETFHLLYDEQSLVLKHDIEKWFTSNPSKNSRYAFLLMNEALATSLGNGYVYGKLNGAEDTATWYNRKYTNLMAKKIYPMVKDYAEQQKAIDKSFVDNYIKIYDDNFSSWVTETDNIMTDRYVVADTSDAFNAIDQKFPYRSMSQSDDNISVVTMEKMKQAPITKVVVVSKNNGASLQLVKHSFKELAGWNPDSESDFNYCVWIAEDKTYLIIINAVRQPIASHLETLKLN